MVASIIHVQMIFALSMNHFYSLLRCRAPLYGFERHTALSRFKHELGPEELVDGKMIHRVGVC